MFRRRRRRIRARRPMRSRRRRSMRRRGSGLRLQRIGYRMQAGFFITLGGKMNCKNPISFRRRSEAPFPCGQCLPCRINYRRIWTHRILLESKLWPSNAFLTLTYRDEDLPEHGSLVPNHHRLFINNLRTQYAAKTGDRLRFYMVGEYGDKTFRPHYHYALFNFANCRGPGPVWRGRKYIPCNCIVCAFISDVWGKGHIFLGKLEYESAQYVAGYVTKKMTKKDDPRLRVIDSETGEILYRFPEFTRMSRDPGIAAGAADVLAASIVKSNLDTIPRVLRHGDKRLPFGRYLTGKIHEKTHLPPAEPGENLRKYETSQMLSMLISSKNDKKVTTAIASGSAAIGMQLVNSQKSLQIEQRFKRKVKQHEIQLTFPLT